MPTGSVRSIIALVVVLGFLWSRVPDEVLLLVLGFYFGSRGSNGGSE